jgi:hypothetical protein
VGAGDNAVWSDVANAINPPKVRLVQQAAQTLAHATNADITFGAGSEELDTHGFHDTASNPARVTPNVAGWYRCRGHVHVASGGGNLTQIVAGLAKNGARVAPQQVTRPDPTAAAGSAASEALISCNGSTDYITLVAQQQTSTSASRDTSVSAPFQSTLEVVYEGPL